MRMKPVKTMPLASDILDKVAAREDLTPLEDFIHKHQPQGDIAAINEWREGLYHAVNTSELVPEFITPTMCSNLFTMQCASAQDPRQQLPTGQAIPDDATRLCRAKLLLEECMETIIALGCRVMWDDAKNEFAMQLNDNWDVHEDTWHDIVDGCCDLIYVATGTMAVLGAADGYHLDAVCEANNAKFPNGVALTNGDGKYLKPEGWVPPDHDAVACNYDIDMLDLAASLHDIQITAMSEDEG